MKSNKFGTLSLVFGIIGLITVFIAIGIIPCLLGFLFGIIGISKVNRVKGTSIAGIICSSIGMFIFLIIAVSVSSVSNETSSKQISKTNQEYKTQYVEEKEETNYPEEINEVVNTENEEIAESENFTVQNDYEDNEQQLTTGQENALRSAENYLSFMPFSYNGLIEQLEFEKYSYEDAVYAADNCGADWNEQAAKKAKDYLDIMAFSKDGLIEQLEFDGFTHEQAVYGAEANGY